MVYKSKRSDERVKQTEIIGSPDPLLLRAARKIYKTYLDLHSQLVKHPLGVAINRNTYRGQLIFKERAILLPGECFVPLNQIESEVY